MTNGSYPGMSTAVRRSREIDSLVTDISKQPVQDLSDVLNPGSALYEAIQELVNLSQQAFNSAMAIASSQAGPIVVSILAPTVKKADKVISGIKGSTYRPRSSADWDRLWERTSFLLSSEQQTWPDRKFHRLGELFETVEDYQNWSLLTSNYLMQKASSECERFLPKQKLNKIGIKDSDGIWKARHRLYHVNHANPSLGISTQPFLIDSRSPLAWSIALFVHNTAVASPLLWRPSSRSHKHWRECHRKSLEYGVILGYQSIFKRIAQSCITCIKRKAKVCRVAGGPLHFTQLTQAKLGADSTFKYIMLDLTAPLRFGKTDTDQNVLYTLVSVCLVSKLTHVVSMDNKKKESFLLALNVLFGEVDLPTKLYVDEEKGLLAMHREMLIEVNEVILKQHEVAIEQVTARQHSAHGLVERRMMVFGELMGTLDIKQADMTKTEASNYMRIIAARLNAKPYGIRFVSKSDIGPLHPAQDLPMEVISPNHWRISHRPKGGSAAFVHLPGSLKGHQGEVHAQLKTLADFYDKKMLPSLLLDVDRKRTVTDTPLMVNSIVMFWPNGDKSKMPKRSQPKFARVIALETSKDGKIRKARISYTNASQLKTDADGQLAGGPT